MTSCASLFSCHAVVSVQKTIINLANNETALLSLIYPLTPHLLIIYPACSAPNTESRSTFYSLMQKQGVVTMKSVSFSYEIHQPSLVQIFISLACKFDVLHPVSLSCPHRPRTDGKTNTERGKSCRTWKEAAQDKVTVSERERHTFRRTERRKAELNVLQMQTYRFRLGG